MLQQAISDQKRLVRGEHWLRARYFLRARDGAHHRAWKLLTIAGPAPHEEITCIRELMPRAHITTVDNNQSNILAAIDAGVDEAHLMDIGALQRIQNGYSYQLLPPAPFDGLDPENRFDAVCLDLTGPADDWLKGIVQSYYARALKAQGVMIVTYCYGRDVVERIAEAWRHQGSVSLTRHLKEIPEPIAARTWYILRSLCDSLDSCIQYRGNAMPMVSCLLLKKNSVPDATRFITVDRGDYELAVTAEDLGNIYACPVDRILELRRHDTRKLAAQKAVRTRRLRQAQPLTLLTFKKPD